MTALVRWDGAEPPVPGGGAVSAAEVLSGAARWSVDTGEALALLQALPDASVSALVTDSPYSSGGMFRGDRAKGTGEKYSNSDIKIDRPDFAGDTRDQHSYGYWCALWLSECLRVTVPGAPICMFTDWRQLAITTDSIQAGGWVFRGVAVWDKTEGSRPQMGAFRSQSEFIVWGSNGPVDDAVAASVGCLPGVFRHVVRQDDKFHQTGKPTPLMMDIVRICPPGGIILDPFAGSGTTLVAALTTGRRAIGFERTQEYSEIARRRCAGSVAQADWREPTQVPLFGGPQP